MVYKGRISSINGWKLRVPPFIKWDYSWFTYPSTNGDWYPIVSHYIPLYPIISYQYPINILSISYQYPINILSISYIFKKAPISSHLPISAGQEHILERVQLAHFLSKVQRSVTRSAPNVVKFMGDLKECVGKTIELGLFWYILIEIWCFWCVGDVFFLDILDQLLRDMEYGLVCFLYNFNPNIQIISNKPSIECWWWRQWPFGAMMPFSLAMMLFDEDLPVETVLDIVYDKHYMLMENCGVSMISLR